MAEFQFEIGHTVRDVVTGFTGVIMARVQYLTGCNQYHVQPSKLAKDGSVRDGHYFDENRLEWVKGPTTLKAWLLRGVKRAEDRGGPSAIEPPRKA